MTRCSRAVSGNASPLTTIYGAGARAAAWWASSVRTVGRYRNGSVTCGPFPTRRAAERDLKKFAHAYLEFARAKIPGLRIIPTSEGIGTTVSLFEPSPKRQTLH